MVDFREQLNNSPRKYYTLAQAFTEATGKGINVRLMQKILKQHQPETILKAIEAMEGRNIDRPIPYMMGILKNWTNAKNGQEFRENTFSSAVASMLEARGDNRPELRSPFHETTAA